MRILELTNFSAGGCGVWARVQSEAEQLTSRGHDVRIYSSNRVKGSNELAQKYETMNGINIQRFPSTKLGGESFMKWNFEKEAIEYCPEIIIAHSYRHRHTTSAIKIAKQLGCKVFLVTHAPFDRDGTRNFIQKIAVRIYDKFIGPKTLKKFDKVYAISEWEIPYLNKLGVSNPEILPNGVSEEFYKNIKNIKPSKNIVFTGRVARIKQIETVIEAMHILKNKKIMFSIIGPEEQPYGSQLQKKSAEYKLNKQIKFIDKKYKMREQIDYLDKSSIFILPSKTEGMSQALIEAMARRKIVIASENSASKEIINDGNNGFIYKNGDASECAKTIKKAFALSSKEYNKLTENASSSVQKYSWKNIIDKLEAAMGIK